MKIILDKKEAESFFYDAMCNGLNQLGSYDIQIDYSYKDYKAAKATLVAKTKEVVCYEDVLMQIIRMGKPVYVIDMDGHEHKRTIKLKDIHERVAKTPMRHLLEYVNETGGDAITADAILQTVIYGEIIYG